MAPRRTIGDNPLDMVIPAPAPARAPASTAAPALHVAPAPAPRPSKERLTVHLPLGLIDRVKNAVYWTPGLTLAGLAEDALAQAVDALEAARGEAYPKRHAELKGGRPMK